MHERETLSDLEDPAAWSQAALRRQVERLDALAELGLGMAQAIAAEKADGAVTAFSRVARVVRQCGLLQSKLIQHMEDARRRALIYAPMTEQAAALAQDRERVRLDPAHAHKTRVEKIVERQVRARHKHEDEVERLMLEACDRLDDDDIYRDVQTRPVGELVALICKDLGIDPDWERLSREAWAQEEIRSGAPGSPFNGTGAAPPRSAEHSEEPMGVGENHRITPAVNGHGRPAPADPDPYP